MKLLRFAKRGRNIYSSAPKHQCCTGISTTTGRWLTVVLPGAYCGRLVLRVMGRVPGNTELW